MVECVSFWVKNQDFLLVQRFLKLCTKLPKLLGCSFPKVCNFAVKTFNGLSVLVDLHIGWFTVQVSYVSIFKVLILLTGKFKTKVVTLPILLNPSVPTTILSIDESGTSS